MITPPLPEASRSETTFCSGVQSRNIESLLIPKNTGEKGPHAQQAALEAGAEMKRKQAFERLETFAQDLQEFVQSKVNIHKEIKTKTTSVLTALRRYKKLDEEWQATCQRSLWVAPERPDASVVTNVQEVSETETGMDIVTDADIESVDEKSLPDNRSFKRKQRTSPESTDKLVKRIKDSKPSPLKEVRKNSEAHKNKPQDWQKVQSSREKKKQLREQRIMQPPPQTPKPQSVSKQKKRRRTGKRSEALIICPKDKEKYSDILHRIKSGVPEEKVRSTVEKLRRTNAGNILIVLSRDNTDKGHALQQTIVGILNDEATVISRGPQEDLEIRDLDDTTTKEDILAALQKTAGEECQIPAEAIKSLRKAYGGTQIAILTLPATIAHKVIGEHGRIRIGWVNCRIRLTERPTQCYKCWHFGHVAGQCRSQVDRRKLCIRCGKDSHKVAECKNTASCVLCVGQHGKDSTHHAGTSRCPFFREALQKLKSGRK